jgi:hypothetical protein
MESEIKCVFNQEVWGGLGSNPGGLGSDPTISSRGAGVKPYNKFKNARDIL